MSPALEAHFRLMSTLSARVQTHIRQPAPKKSHLRGDGKSRNATRRLHRKILRMHDAGMRNTEICAELQISKTTCSKHLNGHIKMGKKK